MSAEQLRKLAREQLSLKKVSDLNLEELEKLAVEHSPATDISKLTLKELKWMAACRLVHKQASVSMLPYREIERLAKERLKSRASNEVIMPAETRATASSPILNQRLNQSTTSISSTNRQRFSNLGSAGEETAAPSLARTASNPTSSRSLRWQGPLLKNSVLPKTPNTSITSHTTEVITPTCGIFSIQTNILD